MPTSERREVEAEVGTEISQERHREMMCKRKGKKIKEGQTLIVDVVRFGIIAVHLKPRYLNPLAVSSLQLREPLG
jgi:hypothetical protein